MPAATDPLASLSPRTAAILCYIPVLGWIACVVVLASPRFAKDQTLRFHAFQGIYLFVGWLLVDWVLGPMFGWMREPGFMVAGAKIAKLAVMFAWVWMLIKTSQGEVVSLPIIGELAERSVAEQR